MADTKFKMVSNVPSWLPFREAASQPTGLEGLMLHSVHRSRHLLRFTHLSTVWQFRALPFGLNWLLFLTWVIRPALRSCEAKVYQSIIPGRLALHHRD